MSNLSNITVAILAGGIGKRLQSVVFDRPKVLAEVNNRPFLEILLNQLDFSGFQNVVICTGYLGDQIKRAFGNKYKKLNLVYSHEFSPLGTAGALRFALPLLQSPIILAMNGDSFCEVDFKKFWQFHLTKAAKASLVLSSVSDTSRFGKVKLGSNDSIIGFQEKKDGAGFINAGIYLIKKSLIEKIPESKEISIEKDVFPNIIGKGFYGYRSNNNFIDIGTPVDFAQAEEFFAQFKL